MSKQSNKAAMRKAEQVKAEQASKPTKLIPLFAGFASLDFRKSDSLFPGFVELGMWILKSEAASARDMLRSAKKERRAMRKAARAERRAARLPYSDASVFNFGIVKARTSKSGNTYRVTFNVPADFCAPATIAA